MVRSARSRAALAAAAAALVVAPAMALANTGTGSQNRQLTVTASALPDPAVDGDTVTFRACVANNTAKPKSVQLTETAYGPAGGVIYGPITKTVSVTRGTPYCDEQPVTIGPLIPRGTYTLKVKAKNARGASKATATVTVA